MTRAASAITRRKRLSMNTNPDRRHQWMTSIALLALVASAGCSRPPAQEAASTEAVDPVRTLQRMSETLAQASQMTFKATRHLDAALVEATGRAESSDIEVWVSRPRMLRARLTSDGDVRGFYIDGERVSMIDESMKLYASAPLSGTIDDIIAVLDEQYGFTPPLAEFALNDPYKKLSTLIQTSAYQGSERIGDQECDHITLVGEVADAALWISRADHLPRRFVATFKDREGSPQLKIEFSEWNLTAKLDAPQFAFTPPTDAEKIVMTTLQDANAPATKGGAK